MANGVPINSLSDLLMLRELRDQARPGFSAMKALSDGVQIGIAQEQEDARLRKIKEEEFNRALRLQEAKTNSNKINNLRDFAVKKGAIIPRDADIAEIERIAAGEVREEEARETEKIIIKKEQLEQEKERNVRLAAQRKLNVNIPVDIDTENPSKVDRFVIEELGINPSDAIELGLAERKSGGKISLLPSEERERLLSPGVRTFPQKIATAIDEFKDSKDILTDVAQEFKDLKLDLNTKDRSLIQQLFAESGILSVSARNNILRQFRNPQVASLYSKLERAFQKYRVKTTGAQASDKELKQLRPLISRLVDEPEVFMNTLNDLRRELDQSVSNRLETQRNLGRDENVINRIEQSYFGGRQPIRSNTITSPEPVVLTPNISVPAPEPSKPAQTSSFSYLWE